MCSILCILIQSLIEQICCYFSCYCLHYICKNKWTIFNTPVVWFSLSQVSLGGLWHLLPLTKKFELTFELSSEIQYPQVTSVCETEGTWLQVYSVSQSQADYCPLSKRMLCKLGTFSKQKFQFCFVSLLTISPETKLTTVQLSHWLLLTCRGRSEEASKRDGQEGSLQPQSYILDIEATRYSNMRRQSWWRKSHDVLVAWKHMHEENRPKW